MNKKYLPKKPANGGIPANENIAMIVASAIKGFFLPKPSNASNPSFSFCLETTRITVNAAIVAIE